MLTELRVKNLGIIGDVTWRLAEGLNVVTGETGAGKSLMLDAVELLLTGKALSGKAGEDVIRYGADDALIEGVFSLPDNAGLRPLRGLLAEKDLGGDEDTLIISCRFRRKGTGVVRVNGRAVVKSLLHQIGRLLIDVHSQSEHYALLDARAHLDILDSYAGNQVLRDEFGMKVTELRQAEQELRSLETGEQTRAARLDLLRFQLDEIDRAKLKDGEDAELETERNILSSTEKLKEISYEVYNLLSGEDRSERLTPALDLLNKAAAELRKLVELDASLAGQYKYLEEAVSGLTETARDIYDYSEKLQHEPARLQEVESRLDLIRGLKKKYGPNLAGVLALRDKIRSELDSAGSSEERLLELKAEIDRRKKEMGEAASRLSKQRSEAALKLSQAVKSELNDLNMTQVVFSISLKQSPAEDGIPYPDGTLYAFDGTGADSAEFMASTNPGEPVRPLAAIASTGELSRFTLALKSALAAADNIPVLIFDEIDIGIGGRSGEIIGKKLWLLGRSHQVVCVTHLPQIAVFADAHFGVHKSVDGERTVSTLEELNADSRLSEIAVMLAGPGFTKTSLKSAAELLQKAEKWEKLN